MANNPRVASLLRQVALSFQNRIRPFRDSFSLILFSLLFGFLLANIFGTFLNVLRDAVSWDGFVILGILLFVEITNYSTYHPLRGSMATPSMAGGGQRTRSAIRRTPVRPGQRGGRSRQLTSNAAIVNREVIYRIVNSFKIGLLLGFFVEAFKVGS
uniref:Hypothetical chloroplast RF20 n=1 Tax=Paradoxia multiseta TaxID=249350 RepID=A0A097KP79_9CHLO|nr:hypothetical chloroplast RF20 [Paradoxia multiseta]AIT94970.1 hypothetical chloroplast RF20 [Paradoxia multiseta]